MVNLASMKCFQLTDILCFHSIWACMILIFSCFLIACDAAKLRSWLDSSVTFVEGHPPSLRDSLGLTSTEDGKIYVFGGSGPNGKEHAIKDRFKSSLPLNP